MKSSLLILIGITPLFVSSTSAIVGSYYYPFDSSPHGKSYSDWAVGWTKFAFERPQLQSPINDLTGHLCAVDQTGEVWYLVGLFGGHTIRECTIPFGKAIVISPSDTFCNKAEDPSVGDDENKIRQCAKLDEDSTKKIKMIIDGVDLGLGPNDNRLQTPVFNLTIPDGDNPGTYKTVTDGVFLVLRPLTIGNHTLEFGATGMNNEGVIDWTYDVTYHLVVK